MFALPGRFAFAGHTRNGTEYVTKPSMAPRFRWHRGLAAGSRAALHPSHARISALTAVGNVGELSRRGLPSATWIETLARPGAHELVDATPWRFRDELAARQHGEDLTVHAQH